LAPKADMAGAIQRQCVFRAEGVAPGRQGRLRQNAEWPVQLGKDCAGAVEVRGEAGVYVLGAPSGSRVLYVFWKKRSAGQGHVSGIGLASWKLSA
jgi:hypothetical protein